MLPTVHSRGSLDSLKLRVEEVSPTALPNSFIFIVTSQYINISIWHLLVGLAITALALAVVWSTYGALYLQGINQVFKKKRRGIEKNNSVFIHCICERFLHIFPSTRAPSERRVLFICPLCRLVGVVFRRVYRHFLIKMVQIWYSLGYKVYAEHLDKL